jgi:hypothetical protein
MGGDLVPSARAPGAARTVKAVDATVELDRVSQTLGTLLLILGAIGCAPPPVVATTPPAPARTGKLAVLPAESDAFPIAARYTTERLRRARVRGLDEPQLSKVSLEVVQLSIECVEPTAGCYEAVGKELGANGLLFAEIAPGPKPDQVQVLVTLFDVDAKQRKRAAAKVFASEEDVAFGVAEVVAEVTKP